MASEQPELQTEKPREPVFRRLRHHWLRNCVILFVLLFAGLAVWVGLGLHEFGRPAIDGKTHAEVIDLYGRIQNGMTRQEVVALLGQPKLLWLDANRQRKGSVECWRYVHRGGWEFLDVLFSAEGKVVDKTLDT